MCREINDYITCQLDKVISLTYEYQKTKSVILSTKTKRRSVYLIEISPDEKSLMLEKTKKGYFKQIDLIYHELNQILEKSNYKILPNPFQNERTLIK